MGHKKDLLKVYEHWQVTEVLTQTVDTGRYPIQPVCATRRDTQTKEWLLHEAGHVSVICRYNAAFCNLFICIEKKKKKKKAS